MSKSWSLKDDRRVMELAKASKTLEQIAKAMNRSPERIRKVAIRLGVSIKSQAASGKPGTKP
jgi:DNA-binding CsgD family transcriptional regulator